MKTRTPDIVVAGHICLDLIPAFGSAVHNGALLSPGELIEVGPPVMATGGAVSNTGLALHHLGLSVQLIGKVGDDMFGRAVIDILRKEGDRLSDGMVVTDDDQTSYTLVINPAGVDRAFLHCPGANNTFGAVDISTEQLEDAHYLHFGYPPLMRRMYADGGVEMTAVLKKARAVDTVTSLDMAFPDPDSEAGRTDWSAWLRNVLPHVDIFSPSLEEIQALLGYQDVPTSALDHAARLSSLADELLAMGAGIVALKLGEEGLYLRTATEAEHLSDTLPGSWSGRELIAPCFQVEAIGTTGAGDCTVAGLLAGLASGASPEEAVTLATAVGAYSVEERDSTSGVPRLHTVRQRVADGWERRFAQDALKGWGWNNASKMWHGPHDATAASHTITRSH